MKLFPDAFGIVRVLCQFAYNEFTKMPFPVILIHNLFFKIFYLFIYLFFHCVGSQLQHVRSFVVTCGLFTVVRRLLSSSQAHQLRCAGSLVVACGLQNVQAQQLWCEGSRVHRFCSCGMQGQLPHGMWVLSSLTRDRTSVPCIAIWILNHWSTREVPDS